MILIRSVDADGRGSVDVVLFFPVRGCGYALERMMSARRASVLRPAERVSAFEIMSERCSSWSRFVGVVAAELAFRCCCMAASNSRGRRTCRLRLRSNKVSSCCLLFVCPLSGSAICCSNILYALSNSAADVIALR